MHGTHCNGTFEAQSASNLAWAEVAISVYERLAAEANSSAQEF